MRECTASRDMYACFKDEGKRLWALQYVVVRFQLLAACACMYAFKWHVGSSITVIVMHLIKGRSF
jgi:hypothetical protein